jgi:hypothetical protein
MPLLPLHDDDDDITSAINVPTAGALAFLKHYPQGERATTHHASPLRVG